jgi:hypothetical protein
MDFSFFGISLVFAATLGKIPFLLDPIDRSGQAQLFSPKIVDSPPTSSQNFF